VITEIDGKPAVRPSLLTAISLTKKPGETVQLIYSRAGQSATATVTLAVAR
jgi:S1-C subfamily serine protease